MCDSILKVAAQPSPMSTTPAFSPMPTSSASDLGAFVGELPQMHLGRLVRAVLGPHDAVDGQLGAGGTAAEDLADPVVLVLLHAQLGVRLRLGRASRRPRLTVSVAHAFTSFLRIEVKKPRPSVLGRR